MKAATNWCNGTALAFALAASMAAAVYGAQGSLVDPTRPGARASSEIVVRQGKRGLVDASGRFVPLRHYKRIMPASLVASSLLHALCEPDRIVAYKGAGSAPPAFAYRFSGKPVAPDFFDIEAVLSLAPDLVLLNSINRADSLERLREVGIVVFDLGSMRGLRTLIPNLRSVAVLLGRSERGAEIARRLVARMQALAWRIPVHERKGGLYVGMYGDKLLGGTRGTSYHDVLSAAGLIDVAAKRFRGWPSYSAEQLLQLQPEVVVTRTGGTRMLCGYPGLESLLACSEHGRVIEIDPSLLSDPGLDMLEAAEALHEALYPEP
ncbi:MAG: ABC transporter substrate-binding protein [Proteobacteria bacterium]|nr:ABC transporter substrate-binding protein [Pseudomonadota bacterium]